VKSRDAMFNYHVHVRYGIFGSITNSLKKRENSIVHVLDLIVTLI
jgi:hypothetical protein